MPAHSAKSTADLVLVNGKIVTMDNRLPVASALAARKGVILQVGSDKAMFRHLRRDTQIIDLQGNLAVPAFIEGHGHFLGIGNAAMQIPLANARNWGEIVGLVAERAKAAEPGELIRGRGWHQEKWDETPSPNIQGLPLHHALSEASPDNPVVLTHASGHSALANAKAMEMAGVSADTPDPPGGEILREKEGRPTGAFRQAAKDLLSPVMGLWDPDLDEQINLATREVVSKGMASFHDAGETFQTIETLRKRADEGNLGVRLWVMVREPNDRLAAFLPDFRMPNDGNRFLAVRSIKKYIDGALGTHGAWLLEPYSDLPGASGFNTTPLEELAETAALAIEFGFQLCIHAIGDRGVREVLNLYERTFKAHPERKGLRWRMEHAQHVHPDDIPRFGKLGVIASMQGIHCTSDGPWAAQRLGEKRAREGAYPWRSLLDSGAVIANGTDAPVEDVDPIRCFYASVARRCADGEAFYPDQCMTRMEALRSYTIDAAYAAFEENVKGSLAPGKFADIAVLSKDILSVPEEEIPEAEVLCTVIGGKVAYRKAEGDAPS